MTDHEERTLTHLLDGVEHAAEGPRVSVDDVLHEFGDRAITPLILLVAVILISPVSGIPGVPTASAIILVILSSQALFGRRRLWLPGRMKRMTLDSHKIHRAVEWLRKPCAFVDRHTRPRLRYLTSGPMRWVTLLFCVVVPLSWPPLEILPFFTSFGAGIVALLAFGLFTRDGAYVLAGYLSLVVIAGITYFVVI
ncbi:exopolysaccharide biosynthesis protein [Sulfitobacter noctilucae]|uniref:exopolysaccharide biosynthesis protein n=1 Tax=Sulfitobacter noctilucae TaxID=1342302 RepID=UPI000469CD03|nr:exopolysaccharide biosynthesis protein [Sulfitobacter noctilucae]